MPIPLGILAAAGIRPAAAASYELLESVIVGSSVGSVNFSNVATNYAATYQHLQVRYTSRASSAIGLTNLRLNFGNAGSADFNNNYSMHFMDGDGSSVSSGNNSGTSRIEVGWHIGANGEANNFFAGVIDILDPFETKNKVVRSLSGGTTSGAPRISLRSGAWMNTGSLNYISFSPSGGSIVTGSRFSLYGLKAS